MSQPAGGPTGRDYDVVIVGAGPAGSITALELSRRGAEVLLVDRSTFPRTKVCGCCVNPRALDALERAGEGDLTRRLGAIPLTSLALGCGGCRATVRQPLGVALSREALDHALIEAARARGVTFVPETSAALLPAGPAPYREVRLRRQGGAWDVCGRFVVAATGLTDTLRDRSPTGLSPGSKIGAGAMAPSAPEGYEPGRVHMACATEGYVGLVIVEDGRLDVAAALRPEAVRRAGGIGPLVARIVRRAGFPEVPGLVDLPWKGTPGLTRAAPKLASERVFRVGDAAGYVEPFTGEGIAWALSGGRRLAELLAEASGEAIGSLQRAWADVYRREVTRTQVVCRAARLTLRVPWLTATMVRVLDRAPGLARPVVRSLHQPRSAPMGTIAGRT